MLQDVLACVRGAGLADSMTVATADPDAARAARAEGAAICDRDAGLGLNVAVQAAMAGLRAEAVLVLPADLPCLTPADILALARAGQSGFAIAPSRDGDGSNAVLTAPPGCVAPAYGPASFRRHLRAARLAGLRPRIFHAPGLALDIDTPADLALAAARHCGPCTRSVLDGLGLVAGDQLQAGPGQRLAILQRPHDRIGHRQARRGGERGVAPVHQQDVDEAAIMLGHGQG